MAPGSVPAVGTLGAEPVASVGLAVVLLLLLFELEMGPKMVAVCIVGFGDAG